MHFIHHLLFFIAFQNLLETYQGETVGVFVINFNPVCFLFVLFINIISLDFHLMWIHNYFLVEKERVEGSALSLLLRNDPGPLALFHEEASRQTLGHIIEEQVRVIVGLDHIGEQVRDFSFVDILLRELNILNI